MDVKVYKKETVMQPSGKEDVYVPNVIDIIPLLKEGDDGKTSLSGCEVLDGDGALEQMCGLATIWQRGNDPLDLNDGVRWSEAILEEINAVQLMEDLSDAVAAVTPTVSVVFDTVDAGGQQVLKYTLKAAG